MKAWTVRAGGWLLVAGRWVWHQVDIDEVAILLALGLLAAGFWGWWRPGSYFAPAAVLLFMYLPTRYQFVVPPPVEETKKPGRVA